ncbi:MAG: SWIM zinc finger domain-containing protein [Gammaproteobacteria bacterium]|nr:SWIM zinc finger domain-containing protein [Gammaproteobacteria bacterium]
MTTHPKLTEAAIRSLTTAQSFERGMDYYRADAVCEMQRRGNTLLAEVEGNSYEPYQIIIELDMGGVVDADCTCPYERGGFCKHIVAILLSYADESNEITQRPTVDALLADLDRDRLLNLLTNLLNNHSELIDWVEGQLNAYHQQAKAMALPASTTKPRQRHTPIDTAILRRQLQNRKRHHSERDFYNMSSSALMATLGEVLEQAREFVESSDGRNGLAIIQMLAEETVEDWFEYDHEGDSMISFLELLDQCLAEVLLIADLSPAERKTWSARLEAWQGSLGEYSIDEAFNAAIGAAEYGWDYLPLQRAMQGQPSSRNSLEADAPPNADSLTMARLNVLERQGRTDEFLNLSEAEGQTERHATMLVRIGRAEEALRYGLKHLSSPEEIIGLAKVLREHDHLDSALQIGAHGLGLKGHKTSLACWLRDFAAAQGKDDLALKAALAAFDESSTLVDYLAVEPLAGGDWPSVKRQLLAQLAIKEYAYERIDIYLHEGMIEEAIKAVEQEQPYYGTVEKVVDAALESHPDWAFEQCRQQAEPIIEKGQSRRYHHAVRWLEKARTALVTAGREQHWRIYCQNLIDKHYRKYSLVPSLKRLL